MIDTARIQCLNNEPVNKAGRYVLYWMQQSQRAHHNPALDHAVSEANRLDVPMIVVFGLDADYPDANRRHFAFLLEGLAETSKSLSERNIKLLLKPGSPPDVVGALADDAALIVCDRGYLRHQRQWRKTVADASDIRVLQVEGDVVVPIESVSGKREWAARTIRGKINDIRGRFLRLGSPVKPQKSSLPLRLTSDVDVNDWQGVLDNLTIDTSVPAVQRFKPGTAAARRRLTSFIRTGLVGYADARSDPSDPHTSEMSPYLHFGQISPIEIAIKVHRASGPSSNDKEAYLEELIVRRELACNFTFHTPNYDSFQCLPDWARKTLSEHADDERPVRYTRKQMEHADTEDPYWNAAMREMLKTGYMHNYMRMYWGKKILEWCNTPEYAYRTILYLNNKYFLDGRDANSYANVGWLFGLHDRAWTERDIFGKVRYMNANGLESKFDIDAYVCRVDKL